MKKRKIWPKANIFCGFVNFLFKVMAFLSHLHLFFISFFFVIRCIHSLRVLDAVNGNRQEHLFIRWCEFDSEYKLWMWVLGKHPYGSKYYRLFGLIHVFRPNFSVRFINFAFETAVLFLVQNFVVHSYFFVLSFSSLSFSSFPFCHDLWIMDVELGLHHAKKGILNRSHAIKCHRTFIHFLFAKSSLFGSCFPFYLNWNVTKLNFHGKTKIYLVFVCAQVL